MFSTGSLLGVHMKMADFLIQKDSFPPEDDHQCNEVDGEETGICNECRDHASFCDTCRLSNCCAAKELSYEHMSFLREV